MERVSYTAQDIPADPVNLQLEGSEAAISCAFAKAGWSRADELSPAAALGIAISVLRQRAYPNAPVSPLYVHDQKQDVAFELEEGPSAKRRHHVRLWREGPHDWLGAASFDRGVGLSLFTLQITHHIGPDLDTERRLVGNLIIVAGGRGDGAISSNVTPGQWHRNGGGDHYMTDGKIGRYMLGPTCPAS
ncbi:MAG: LssY C-terminal domain-containing protein [Sphingomicrobium sp.]